MVGAREGHARWRRVGGAHAWAERRGEFAAGDAGEAAFAGRGALGASIGVAEEGGDGGAEGGHEAGALGHAGAAGQVGVVVGFRGDAGVGWEGLVAELRSSSVVAEEKHGDKEDDCQACCASYHTPRDCAGWGGGVATSTASI